MFPYENTRKNYWFGNYLTYSEHVLNEKIGMEVNVHV
jgi:hypothetical protein